ncbi:MAG: hypothetical protein KAG97_12730, partial [Victivallales bacterium]|nr:hypothetical protein [Victivallales bacterium]
WKQRSAKLADERKQKAEEKKKREERLKKRMKELGEEPQPPQPPKKSEPKQVMRPAKKTPPPPKGILKTTLYMLNSKKLIGFTVSGEKTPLSWATARIEGDAVLLSRKGDDPITRVRYGYADNPLASLCDKNGVPVLPFDEKVKQNKDASKSDKTK